MGTSFQFLEHLRCTRGEPCFYDGKTFTVLKNKDGKAFNNVWSIIEDKKGNIWTTGEVNPKVWALSRYDAKSLYDKMPPVTEIKSGGRMDFLGILEANDGSIWFGSWKGAHRYDGKTFTDFKGKEVSNNVYSRQLRWNCASGGTFSAPTSGRHFYSVDI